MTRFTLIGFLLTFLPVLTYSQIDINVEHIEIARDEFGVPHIFAETNAEAVYGIAWAQCEDNFNVMQENLAIVKGLYGRIKGKKGAAADFIMQLFEVDHYIDNNYEKDITPEIENLLQAYVTAINRYAELHPSEVISKKLFPATTKDILKEYVFNYIILSYAIMDVARIIDNKIDFSWPSDNMLGAGSNAMAYNANITNDGKTYLVGNPHQPVEGPANFWELSVHSKEGLDIFGATFSAGGVTPFIGTNRHLGWTSTTNFEDYTDVYQLKMHPKKKDYYEFDGEWLKLEKKHAKLKVKVGPLIIPARKKYFISKYGPTLKNKSGYFSIRSNAFFNLRFVEHYYKMALSQNFDEFWEALKVQGIPNQTITYADGQNNIMFFNNGIFPKKKEHYNWREILPGNTSDTFWNYDEIHPIDNLVYVKNPRCGYVYNCNNTPLDCTAADENPTIDNYPKTFGIMTSNTARAKRFKELMEHQDNIGYEEIKKMRDDEGAHSTDLSFRQFMNANDVFTVAGKYPEFADLKKVMDKWDRKMNIENKQATIFALFSMYFTNYIIDNYAVYENVVSEKVIVDGLRFTKKFLLKNYNSLEVELGRVQKIVRGDREYPMYGGPQILANAQFIPYEKGKIKIKRGDTFIMYACYDKTGLESMKTVNVFGNSSKPDSPYYTNQLEMYTQKQVKDVELDLNKIRSTAKSIYHPK